jgi:hypothetical protein
MCFLGDTQTLDVELEVLDPSRGPAVVRRIDQRLENAPDFRPAFSNGQAQGVRVLFAKDRYIGIVVDGNIVRPPPQQEGKPIGQHHAKRGAQGRRPSFTRAKRRFRPVKSTNTRAHFAVTGEPDA